MKRKKSIFKTGEGWVVRILYKVENTNKDAEKSQSVHCNEATALAHSILCLTPSCFLSFLLSCLESSFHCGRPD